MNSEHEANDRPTFHVGAKAFTEQYILAEILAQTLADASMGDVSVTQSLGSSVAFEALRGGAIDLYVEYTGTLWSILMKRPLPLPAPAVALQEMTTFLHEQAGATLGPTLGFSNVYTLAVRTQIARNMHLESTKDLAPVASQLRAAGDYEFFSRPEWAAIKEA